MGDLLGLEGHELLRFFPFRLPVLFAASQILGHGPERRVGRISPLVRVGSGLARLGRLLPDPFHFVAHRYVKLYERYDARIRAFERALRAAPAAAADAATAAAAGRAASAAPAARADGDDAAAAVVVFAVVPDRTGEFAPGTFAALARAIRAYAPALRAFEIVLA